MRYKHTKNFFSKLFLNHWAFMMWRLLKNLFLLKLSTFNNLVIRFWEFNFIQMLYPVQPMESIPNPNLKRFLMLLLKEFWNLNCQNKKKMNRIFWKVLIKKIQKLFLNLSKMPTSKFLLSSKLSKTVILPLETGNQKKSENLSIWLLQKLTIWSLRFSKVCLTKFMPLNKAKNT